MLQAGETAFCSGDILILIRSRFLFRPRRGRKKPEEAQPSKEKSTNQLLGHRHEASAAKMIPHASGTCSANVHINGLTTP